jgi:hypothetical protein
VADSSLCAAAGCGVVVEWRRHIRTGNLAPVDMRADPGGNVMLVGSDQYRILGKNEPATGDLFSGGGTDRFVLHFVTCTEPERFRRRCDNCKQKPCIRAKGCKT